MYGSKVTLTNVTLHGNRGSAIRTVYGSSAITATNSILWGNWPDEIQNFGDYSTINITYSDVQQASGVYSGTGNINSDPLFVTPIDVAETPTTAGDVHISPVSPVIDAGNNDDVTTLTDLDNSPRRIDVPIVPDTGNGTAPIVDMGAYESLGIAPDLQAGKNNNVSGAIGLNQPFAWTVVISNTGNAPAEFADTARVLNDDLTATDATYGAPQVSATGLTGTIACAVETGPSLQCAASGAATLAVSGRITITLPVTPTAFGTLVNPRLGGDCLADPDGRVAEIFDDNNTCGPDSVAVGQATLTTVIRDATDTIVTSAPISATIYGQATVFALSGLTPTGVVTLTLHDDAACANAPLATDVQPLVNGVADSATMEARSFYYQVLYSGDTTYLPQTGPCTLFSAYQPGPTFTVNTTADDTLDDVCSDIHCTLRDAINAANDTPGDNTILFEVGDDQTLTLASALPGISALNGALTIDGETHALTISGADLYRVFKVNSNAQATLVRLTVAHGQDTSSECGGSSCGGGLKIESGASVTVTYSAILSNRAALGGGIVNEGVLRIDHSLLASNTATQYGGGILNSGTLLVENSTLSGNAANGTDSYGGGGALDQWGSSATAIFTDSTVVNNTAANPNQARSGIWLENGMLTLHNTIVANNNGSNNFQQDGGTFTSQGYNLSNDWNGLALQPTDRTGDPLLGALADNGGETLTHMPLSGSPAIDGGDPANCPTTDQRGFVRPQPSGGICDIGAVEWLAAEIAVLGNGVEIADGDVSPNVADHTDFGGIGLGEAITYTFTISNSGTDNLNLTGSPRVTLTGATTDFSVVAWPAAQVGPYLTTTFAVRFAPTAMGVRTATVSIANSDSNDGVPPL
ncbi:MAG: choice-of-anchor D domain-containing protein [Anaerolineales bacterium]|nr:choice-of-anchor D domain-containing protein [Anaerolineales bacterium]